MEKTREEVTSQTRICDLFFPVNAKKPKRINIVINTALNELINTGFKLKKNDDISNCQKTIGEFSTQKKLSDQEKESLIKEINHFFQEEVKEFYPIIENSNLKEP